MYAVIRTGGQQTTVREGETIEIQKIPGEVGEEVVFDDVLIVRDDKATVIGRPRVEKAKVVGKIVSQHRGPKIRVYKFKRRKGYSRTQGHRQPHTGVLISKIKH
jgi:large subunit ribosomal protein L21